MAFKDHITRRLFDQSTCPIYIKNRYLKYVYVNQAYGALFGRLADDFKGCSAYDFIDRDRASDIENLEINLFETKRSEQWEEEFITPTGDHCYYSILAQTFEDHDGQIFISKIYTDISEQKYQQFELEEQLLHQAVFEGQLDAKRRAHFQNNRPIDLSNRRFVLFDQDDHKRGQLIKRFDAWGIDCAACQTAEEVLAIMWSMHDLDIKLDGVFIDMESALASAFDVFDQFASDDILAMTPICLIYRSQFAHEANDLMGLYTIDELLKYPVQPSGLLRSLSKLIEIHDHGNQEDNNTDNAFSKRVKIGLNKIVNQTQSYNRRQQVDILVFEPNTVKQIAIAKILSTTEFTFKMSGDGDRAMELISMINPKLFLYDLSIEHIQNERVSNRARRHLKNSDFMPIIGLNDKKDHTSASLQRLNVNDIVSKPISAHELISKVKKWLKYDFSDQNHANQG